MIMMKKKEEEEEHKEENYSNLSLFDTTFSFIQ